jgi:UDP-N-acetylmuramoyl-L-alanyl-D-glutamate--2,6-diaminopimelate ligase
MNLGEILSGVALLQPLAPELAQAPVAAIEYDSRRVAAQSVFFAFPGSKADGRQFAADAWRAARWPWSANRPRRPISRSGGFKWRMDGRHSRLPRVISSGGPTSASLLPGSPGPTARPPQRTDRFGTSRRRQNDGDDRHHRISPGRPRAQAVNTTPESLDLCVCSRARNAGGTHVTMEVSSHALALGRVYGCNFHTTFHQPDARPSGFSRRHGNYFAAKQLLFEGAGGAPPRYAVLNREDAWARRIKVSRKRSSLVRSRPGSRLRPRHIASGFSGLRFDLQYGKQRFPVESPLIGKINVYNILAACAAGLSYGLAPK